MSVRAVPPFGMSRTKRRVSLRRLLLFIFCFSVQHIFKNAAASFFFICCTVSSTCKVSAVHVCEKYRTQKDNSILRYSPRAVKPRRFCSVRSLGARRGEYSVILPIFRIPHADF